MINANDFSALTDSETLESAIRNRQSDGIVTIPPRVSDIEPERDWWLIDRAILIPENTTVILEGCTIKLSDKCRDNFFRTENCGLGIDDPKKIKNVHLRGTGTCTLVGADHPRATGDASKTLADPCPYETEDLCRLADWIPEESKKTGKIEFWDRHNHSFGTDAGKEGESQYGDWRGIGVLFANAQNFSIEGLRIVKSHGWGISVEECSHGRISRIEFDACMTKEIDGLVQNMENQDGVDIRNGCHDIIISDITGRTGDDMVALTAVATDDSRRGGSLKSTHVMHHDWTRRERDIHDIIIRNVVGHSHLCYSVRLLSCNAKIWNVVVDGVIDTTVDCTSHSGVVLIGDHDTIYGKNLPDSITNVTISNVICNARTAVRVLGYLKDSTITNVVNRNPNCPAVKVAREDGLINVATSSLSSASDILIG